MPFVTSHSHPVQKALEEVIDPVMLADITALASLYRNAMVGMSAAVTQARRDLEQQGQLGTVDLGLFQQVFTARAIEFLREALGEISASTAEQILASAQTAMRTLPSQISLNMAFDRNDPRAILWAQQRAGSLIRQIEAEALQSVRSIISGVLTTGGGVYRAASQISRVVGLHDRWQTAVNNYYGKEVTRLTGGGMDADDAIVVAQESALLYRNELILARANMIARTEILAANNIGQMLSWYQAADQGFLDLATAEKEWVVGPDGWKGVMVCPRCMEMSGERVPVASVFSNGEIAPPLHPNCRCVMNLIVLADMEGADVLES